MMQTVPGRSFCLWTRARVVDRRLRRIIPLVSAVVLVAPVVPGGGALVASASQGAVVAELIDHNEPGVAVEMLTAILDEAGASLTSDQAAQIERLVDDMGLDETVSRQARAMVRPA